MKKKPNKKYLIPSNFKITVELELSRFPFFVLHHWKFRYCFCSTIKTDIEIKILILAVYVKKTKFLRLYKSRHGVCEIRIASSTRLYNFHWTRQSRGVPTIFNKRHFIVKQKKSVLRASHPCWSYRSWSFYGVTFSDTKRTYFSA